MKAAVVSLIVLALVLRHCSAEVKSCSSSKCSLVKVSCLYVEPKDCKSNEVFVPRDGYCYCCDTCVPKTGRCLKISSCTYIGNSLILNENRLLRSLKSLPTVRYLHFYYNNIFFGFLDGVSQCNSRYC